jgi:hypothetical protein
MSESLKAAVLSAVLRLLQPLVRLLLDAGVGVGEFQQLAKRAYVRVARDRSDEAKPNISRIAVLTGITRAEVASILAEPGDAPPPPDRGAHRAERVLQGWWQDPEFIGPAGKPLALPLRGKRRSFAALVQRYAGDPRVATLLDELVKAKAVRRTAEDHIEVLSKTFNTARWDADGVANIGERVYGLLDTLVHNLKHPTRPRFERLVVNTRLDPKYVPLLVRDLTQHTDVLADALQDALTGSDRTLEPRREAQDAHILGIGFYLIEQPTVIPADPSAPAMRRAKH